MIFFFFLSTSSATSVGQTLVESGRELLRSQRRKDWRMHLRAGPRPVRLGVEGAHLAPGGRAESRGPSTNRGPFPSGRTGVLKAFLPVVSSAGDLESVLLCREVWKHLSPLPRRLAALPGPFPSTHPILPSTARDETQPSQTVVCAPEPFPGQGGC